MTTLKVLALIVCLAVTAPAAGEDSPLTFSGGDCTTYYDGCNMVTTCGGLSTSTLRWCGPMPALEVPAEVVGPPMTALPAVPVAAHEELSFPAALLWAGVPMAVDMWFTSDVLDSRPDIREGNPLGQSVEKRAALALGTTVATAYLFHRIENSPDLKGKWYRKAPRWTVTALHLGAAAWNAHLARRK